MLVSRAGLREVGLWFLCAVVLGLVAIPIRIYLVWYDNTHADLPNLISKEIALPCVILVAGALAQHVIKRINSAWQPADGALAFLCLIVLGIAVVLYLFPPETRAGSTAGLVVHLVVMICALGIGGSSIYRSAL